MSPTRLGPTYEEMLHPRSVDPALRARWRVNGAAAGLFDISWRDAQGHTYLDVLPPELTGVDAPIAVLYGRDMPTGGARPGRVGRWMWRTGIFRKLPRRWRRWTRLPREKCWIAFSGI